MVYEYIFHVSFVYMYTVYYGILLLKCIQSIITSEYEYYNVGYIACREMYNKKYKKLEKDKWKAAFKNFS